MKKTNSEEEAYLRIRSIIGPYGPLPCSRSHFYALIAAGKIPRPIKLGSRISVWRRSDILAYIESAEGANG